MSFTNGDIAKVCLRWQVGIIGLAVNVFQASLTQATPHTLTTLDAVTELGDWISRILLPMAPHIVVSCDIMDLLVYKKVGALWNLEGPAPYVFTPGSIGDPLPSGVAALIEAYTDTSRVQGKKYFVGLSETGQTAGLWVVGVLSAMLQSAVEWSTSFAGIVDPTGRWYPGVWSLKKGDFRVFVAHVSTKDVPAYQRRRKAGVGA